MLLLIGPLGLPEMLLIMALVLLFFGPKKLPEIGRSLGKGIREFKRSTSGFMDSINQDLDKSAAPPPPAQTAQTLPPPPAAQQDPPNANPPAAQPSVPPKDEAVKRVEEVEEVVIDLEKPKS